MLIAEYSNKLPFCTPFMHALLQRPGVDGGVDRVSMAYGSCRQLVSGLQAFCSTVCVQSAPAAL
jgi:hypothetical protein